MGGTISRPSPDCLPYADFLKEEGVKYLELDCEKDIMWDVRIPKGWGIKLLKTDDDDETYGIYDRNGKCIAQTYGTYMMHMSICHVIDCRTKDESIDLSMYHLVNGWYDEIQSKTKRNVLSI